MSFPLPVLLALAVAGSSSAALQEQQPAPEDVPALVQTLKEQRDQAEVDLIKQLANKKTREAMEGLLEVYDAMQSVYMRRAVCQGLALYDDVPGAEQKALEKLMNVATEAKARALREAAVELLGACDDFGHGFLRRIVDSAADDEVRERAMRQHVADARPEDREWYRSLYDPEAAEKAEKARVEGEKIPHQLPQIRLYAFQALAPEMELEKLVQAAGDKNQRIRTAALEELERRDPDKAANVAEDLWDKTTESPRSRLAAARILIRARGEKVAADIIKEAGRTGTPRELVFGLADLLVELDAADVNKKLLRLVGKGKGTEKLFYLRTTARLDDPKLAKTLIKLLGDKDAEVRGTVAEILGERREKAALENLEELVEEEKEPLVITAALGAITGIRANDAAWEERLLAYCESPNTLIRNASIEAVGKTRNPDHLPVLVAALGHEQWSTRLAAARALEALELKAAVGPLCERIGAEEGRMGIEMSEILFRLTGQTFGTSGRQWKDWWAREGENFRLITKAELARIEQQEEERQLRRISRSEFFGIRIESHRVVFILDVSGSMDEATRGQYLGEKGQRRMDVARGELLKAIESLEPGTFFNIVPFAFDVNAWRDRIVERNETTLEEAKGFIGRLRAEGGTNLFGALEFAFEDPDVDTIYVLSDGEPSVGDVIDGTAIRERVAAWNEHRGVVIHSIAVGGSFRILEWLAEDTGGSYVKFP
jgi:Mg-chelatase subunit ChlD